LALFDKEFSAESITKQVSGDWSLVSKAIEALSSKEPEKKFRSGKALMILSKDYPEKLYPWWSSFTGLLSNKNTFLKVIGVTILSNLAPVDKENRFEEIFDDFYTLLDNESMIPAANVAGYSGKIAKAKPELQNRITERLLDIDKTHHSSECKNIIKGKALLSFNEYFEDSSDKEKIVEFVKNELNNKRPATRKKAEKILEKIEQKMI
jgi:hypothetical protein